MVSFLYVSPPKFYVYFFSPYGLLVQPAFSIAYVLPHNLPKHSFESPNKPSQHVDFFQVRRCHSLYAEISTNYKY